MSPFNPFSRNRNSYLNQQEKAVDSERPAGSVHPFGIDPDETAYLCNVCGRTNPMSFKFCPECGTPRFGRKDSNSDTNTELRAKKPEPEDEISAYLRKRGLLALADQMVDVHVMLPDHSIVTISLKGRQNAHDALQSLYLNGYLYHIRDFRFNDWPTADPCIGPWYHHVNACACELDPNRIYHLETYDLDDIRCLYGCPNSKTIEHSPVLNQVSVKVVDYEK